MVYIFALATIISTFLGGLFAIRFRDKLHLILGFSAGAVIGVALFDLIPESINLASLKYPTEIITLFFALGFVFYLIIDRFFSLHCHGEVCEKPSHRGNLGALTLVLHSLIDGLGIGLAFKVSSAIGFVVAAAVLTHDFSDGINTVSMIFRNNDNRKMALKWLALDAIAPAVGVLLASLLTVSQSLLGIILAVFTGLFLYMGASDLIPESHHQHPTIWTTIATVLGILVLFTVVKLAV